MGRRYGEYGKTVWGVWEVWEVWEVLKDGSMENTSRRRYGMGEVREYGEASKKVRESMGTRYGKVLKYGEEGTRVRGEHPSKLGEGELGWGLTVGLAGWYLEGRTLRYNQFTCTIHLQMRGQERPEYSILPALQRTNKPTIQNIPSRHNPEPALPHTDTASAWHTRNTHPHPSHPSPPRPTAARQNQPQDQAPLPPLSPTPRRHQGRTTPARPHARAPRAARGRDPVKPRQS